jgi:hypothetical protein
MSPQNADPKCSVHATEHFKSRGSHAWTDPFGSIGDTIAGLMAIAIGGDASPIALSGATALRGAERVERASPGLTEIKRGADPKGSGLYLFNSVKTST